MAYGDAYLEYRRIYSDISGTLALTTSTDDTTLVTNANVNDTIFIQALRVYILTDAAQSISFEDSNSPAKVVARVPTSPGADMPFVWDFGPKGVPLTVGKNFVANVSATGLAAHIEWDGYQKRTAVASA